MNPADKLAPHRFGVSRGVEPLWAGDYKGVPPLIRLQFNRVFSWVTLRQFTRTQVVPR